jgi:hypothetical protein
LYSRPLLLSLKFSDFNNFDKSILLLISIMPSTPIVLQDLPFVERSSPIKRFDFVSSLLSSTFIMLFFLLSSLFILNTTAVTRTPSTASFNPDNSHHVADPPAVAEEERAFSKTSFVTPTFKTRHRTLATPPIAAAARYQNQAPAPVIMPVENPNHGTGLAPQPSGQKW